MSSAFQNPIPPAGLSNRESGVVERIRNLIGVGDTAQEGEIFFGDDAAVLTPPTGRSLVACTDAAVMGVHLDAGLFGPFDLGWRAMAATLSDIAAMGAEPWRALVTVIGPKAEELVMAMEGAQAAAEAGSTTIVGGDVSAGSELSVSVTALGLLDGAALTRRGACVGETVLLTGSLGASAAGLRLARSGGAIDDPLVLRHLRPYPRLREGAMARALGARAAIDISDGFSLDLGRVAEASGVGVEIYELWVADGATKREALSGGEDYELILVTNAPEALIEGFSHQGLSAPRIVGEIIENRGLWLDGQAIEPSGFDHDL